MMDNLNDVFSITDRQLEMETMDLFLNFDIGLLDDEFDGCTAQSSNKDQDSVCTSLTTGTLPKAKKARTSKSGAKHTDDAKKGQVNALTVALFGAKQPRPKPPSRMRHRPPVLYAFPSYDKCDSLIYFPTALTRLSNSGDFDNLSKLFKTHLDMNCNIEFGFQKVKPTTETVLDVFKFTTEVHPDSFMCVHTTAVVENQIKATIHMKVTDVRSIKDALLRTKRKPIEYLMLQEAINKDILPTSGVPTQEQQVLQEKLKEPTDLIVYLRVDLTLTLDNCTRKVVNWDLKHSVTSVTPVGFRY